MICQEKSKTKKNMGTLSFYLIVAFFCYYSYSPKSKAVLWRYTLLIPLITTGIFLLYSFIINDFNYYKAGQTFSSAVIPTIVFPFVIYFLFRKKLNNVGVAKFPIILVVAIIVTFSLGVYQTNSLGVYQTKKRETTKALVEIHLITEFLKPNLPITTEDGLILYDIHFVEEERFLTYSYRSIYDISHLTDKEINILKTQWKEQLLQTATKSRNKQAFITANVSMIYLLKDKSDKTILEFEINPDDYKN